MKNKKYEKISRYYDKLISRLPFDIQCTLSEGICEFREQLIDLCATQKPSQSIDSVPCPHCDKDVYPHKSYLRIGDMYSQEEADIMIDHIKKSTKPNKPTNSKEKCEHYEKPGKCTHNKNELDGACYNEFGYGCAIADTPHPLPSVKLCFGCEYFLKVPAFGKPYGCKARTADDCRFNLYTQEEGDRIIQHTQEEVDRIMQPVIDASEESFQYDESKVMQGIDEAMNEVEFENEIDTFKDPRGPIHDATRKTNRIMKMHQQIARDLKIKDREAEISKVVKKELNKRYGETLQDDKVYQKGYAAGIIKGVTEANLSQAKENAEAYEIAKIKLKSAEWLYKTLYQYQDNSMELIMDRLEQMPCEDWSLLCTIETKIKNPTFIIIRKTALDTFELTVGQTPLNINPSLKAVETVLRKYQEEHDVKFKLMN